MHLRKTMTDKQFENAVRSRIAQIFSFTGNQQIKAMNGFDPVSMEASRRIREQRRAANVLRESD